MYRLLGAGKKNGFTILFAVNLFEGRLYEFKVDIKGREIFFIKEAMTSFHPQMIWQYKKPNNEMSEEMLLQQLTTSYHHEHLINLSYFSHLSTYYPVKILLMFSNKFEESTGVEKIILSKIGNKLSQEDETALENSLLDRGELILKFGYRNRQDILTFLNKRSLNYSIFSEESF
jgi:hypothetical protein